MGIQREHTIRAPRVQITITILLQEQQLEAMLMKTRRGAFSQGTYLRHLVENYTLMMFQNRRLAHDRARLCYQPPRGDYVRHNIKVNWEIWARLQAIARGLGLSTCCLVAILMAVALSARGGVPTGRLVPTANRMDTLALSISVDLHRPVLKRVLELERTLRNPRLGSVAAPPDSS